MAGFPPPPSFRPAPGQTGQVHQFQYTTAQNVDYAYSTSLQSANMSAFEQNSSSFAPGFEYNGVPPSFNLTGQTSGVPPLPIYGRLNPSALHQNHMWAAPGISNQLETSHGTDQRPFTSQSSSMPQGGAVSLTTRPRQRAVEEGELSEGEYEETNVEEMLVSARGETQGGYEEYRLNRGPPWDGIINQWKSGSGKRAQLPLTDQYGRSRDTRGQSSDSYSPPFSDPPASVLAKDRPANLPLQSTSSHIPEHEKQASDPSKQRQLSMLNTQTENVKPTFQAEQEPENHTGHNTKPVQNARKQAQNAVLNLLPLKVRFQNFIDEGIDEMVIRNVFDDIGISPSYPPTKQQSNGTEQPQHGTEFNPDVGQSFPSTSVNSGVTQIRSKDITSTTKTNGSAFPTSNKGEERKDRIARLLDEKSKKLSNLTRSSTSQRPTSPVAAILSDSTLSNKATVSQSAVRVDKEKLLKQKMEALQKSREARAQKATARLAAAPTIPFIPTESAQPQKPQSQLTSFSASVPITLSPKDPRTHSVSPQQIEPDVSMPSIPGLFLAGTVGTVQTDITQTRSVGQNNNHRKRPVASDFDSNATTNTTYKRPFGHSRNDQPLVIDVSDEESEDESVEMEIDNQVADILVHDDQSTNPLRLGLRDLPPLSDFPPKKSFATPSSSLGTPPSRQAPPRSSARPEDLKKKEFEIQEMRRKIAEAEQRKKAKQIASGSQTPMYKTSTPIETKSAKDASLSNKIDASVQIERLIDDASRRIENDQQKLAEAQVLEEHDAEALKKSETEQRRQRRARIAVDIPAVDAEVQKSQRKLAVLRAEMKNLELAVQKRLEEKRRLAEEMERLGNEVDDQLEAHKDQLRSLTVDMAMEQKVEDLSAHSIVDAQVPPKPLDEHSLLDDSNAETEAGQRDVPMPYFQPSSESPAFQAREVNPEPTISKDLIAPESSPSAAEYESASRRSQPSISPIVELPLFNLANNESFKTMVTDFPASLNTDRDADNSTESNIPESSASQPDLPGLEQLQTSPININIDDSYQPSQKDMEEGSVDDTESLQSKDMEIDEPHPPDPDLDDDVQGQNSSLSKLVGLESNLASTADGDSDAYEPPEATPPSSNEFIAANFTPSSPRSPGSNPDVSGTDQAMSLAPSDGTTEPASSAGVPLVYPSNAENEIESVPKRKTFFTPYESPLKRFKAYRFHPEFIKEVPGGYKSLTYSNNIDTGKELCRFELAGGVCNDVSCEFQHFRDIVLPDELILVALGNSAGYKEEDRMRFIRGLKEVLQDLRSSRICDFHVIASKICAFRQDFFGDRPKILLFGGQAI